MTIVDSEALETLGTIIVPVSAIFAIFVFAPWIHYKHKTLRAAAPDPGQAQEVWDRARRLELRIEHLERLLDAEMPGWRTRS